MKRISFFLLALFAILSLSSCGSGISQADYDNLLNENSALQSEKESLLSENESLVSENESLSDEKKSLLEEQAEQYLDRVDDTFIKTWAIRSFGADSLCFNNEDSYLQCLAGKTYDISEEGISELRADFLESIKTLYTMYGLTSDGVPYKTISIKFFDPSNIYILDITLKQKEDTSYSVGDIICNPTYAEIIASALTSTQE